MPSQVTYQPLDHICSRPRRRHRCACKALDSLSPPAPLSPRKRWGELAQLNFGMHVLGLAELLPSGITAPAVCTGDQDRFGLYFCMMHGNQATLLGAKLLTLTKCSHQGHAMCPHSYPALPPKSTSNLQQNQQSPCPCSPGEWCLGVFWRRFIALGACQISTCCTASPKSNTWDLDPKPHS